MEDSPFKRFIALVNYDQETFQYFKKLANLEDHQKKLEQRIQEYTAARATAVRDLKNLKQDVDAKELEMRSLDTEEQGAKKRLSAIKDQRAYHAVKQEIQTLKEKQQNFEEVLLHSWKLLEAADKAYQESQTQYETSLLALQQDLQKTHDEIVLIKELINTQEHERHIYIENLPEDWLEKYARMKTTVSDPVIPISYDSCSACFTMLPAQDLLALKRRALLQCKGCFRLLYDPVLVGAE